MNIVKYTYDNFTINSIFRPEAFIKKKHALQYQLHSHCFTILYLFILLIRVNQVQRSFGHQVNSDSDLV